MKMHMQKRTFQRASLVALLIFISLTIYRVSHAQDAPLTVIEQPGDNISNEQIMEFLWKLSARVDALVPIVPREGMTAAISKPEGVDLLRVTTRAFAPPAGFRMELVEQEPQYVITQYEQPDVYQAVRIYKPAPPKPKPVVVGTSNIEIIEQITGGSQ